jgi:hypothetical protein
MEEIKMTTETYEERFKDIKAEKVTKFPDGAWAVGGRDLDGRRVWIQLHGMEAADHSEFKGPDPIEFDATLFYVSEDGEIVQQTQARFSEEGVLLDKALPFGQYHNAVLAYATGQMLYAMASESPITEDLTGRKVKETTGDGEHSVIGTSHFIYAIEAF